MVLIWFVKSKKNTNFWSFFDSTFGSTTKKKIKIVNLSSNLVYLVLLVCSKQADYMQ